MQSLIWERLWTTAQLSAEHRPATLGLELIEAQVLLDKGDPQAALEHMQTFLQLRPNNRTAAAVRLTMKEITAANTKMPHRPGAVDDSQALSIEEY